MNLVKFRLPTLIGLCAALVLNPTHAEEVNVYSARKEALIQPVLQRFSDKTGIKVNLVAGKADALITRLASEGKHSPADVLITTDVGRLHRAKSKGLLQAVKSSVLSQSIPANLRDSDNQWFALTRRARPIMYVPGRVDPNELSTMEALTDPKWKGRICIRSSSNIYNQSLVAAMIAQEGEAKTAKWLQGFVKNFARTPKGGDRDQIKAAVAGICDVAIANTYYLAGMLTGSDKKAQQVAQQIKVFWPNQADRGAHVNISGAAVVAHAKHTDAAKKLIEFMTEADTQAWYAEVNNEYPVVADVALSQVLKDFGDFKSEQVQLQKLGELNAQALKLMDKAGWR